MTYIMSEEQLVHKRAYSRQRYIENKERIDQYHRQHYWSDPEKQRERHRLYRLTHKEEMVQYNMQRRLRDKIKAVKIVGRGKVQCAGCPCNDIRVLDINHINGGGRDAHQNIRGADFYRAISSGKRGIDDLNILCKNCNWIHYLELIRGRASAIYWRVKT
jgi:hypothetical protein